MATLPIEPVLPALVAALAGAGRAVLEAPPGAGKTTRVPLALLDAAAAVAPGGRILMLEPRRVAARAAAERLAEALGEPVGGRVGYRIRGESVAGSAIEVVTEGVLTRMLQRAPDLAGVGCVIFDEFHERALQADLGLALALEVRAALRPDLRLLVMSATLDTAPVAALMGGAPVVTAQGRAFAVETRWLDRPAGRGGRASRRPSPTSSSTPSPRPRAARWSSCPAKRRSPAPPPASPRGCRRGSSSSRSTAACPSPSSVGRWCRSRPGGASSSPPRSPRPR